MSLVISSSNTVPWVELRIHTPTSNGVKAQFRKENNGHGLLSPGILTKYYCCYVSSLSR